MGSIFLLMLEISISQFIVDHVGPMLVHQHQPIELTFLEITLIHQLSYQSKLQSVVFQVAVVGEVWPQLSINMHILKVFQKNLVKFINQPIMIEYNVHQKIYVHLVMKMVVSLLLNTLNGMYQSNTIFLNQIWSCKRIHSNES